MDIINNAMEESKVLSNNMLTAEELLKNKGIKSVVWNEFEKSSKVLPKTGKKQFEPNDSWLQEMQIQKGIETCKDLISIERVDRVSQLALAEWLPEERKACVKKYQGQDWSTFGLEKSGNLYLIPEEALFLLEANRLQLVWNDVPLSIQQAYEVLIDNVECSIEEYRVFSQLVRCGYRIQRFVYETLERKTKINETPGTKRKVVVDPQNGLWMSESQQWSENTSDTSNEESEVCHRKTDMKNVDPDIQICHDKTTSKHSNLEDDIHDVMNDLLTAIENKECKHINTLQEISEENPIKSNSDMQATKVNGDKRKQSSNIEIISEETLLGKIKIVREPANICTKENTTVSNWRTSRIQRNVKLLPKRTDKPSADVLVTDCIAKSFNQTLEKRKAILLSKVDAHRKRTKYEVTELSDDEIQEEPRPMTRTELLNLIPNIASAPIVTTKISRGYIPHSIKPYKSVYRYENVKLRNLQETDKKLRLGKRIESCKNNNNNNHHNTSRNENTRRNIGFHNFNQNLNRNVHDVFMREYSSMNRGEGTHYEPPYMYNNRYPFPYSQNVYFHHRNTLFQNVSVALENSGSAIYHNRFLSIQMNNYALQSMGNVMRNSFLQNNFRHNFHQNFLQRKMQQHRSMENMSYHYNVARNICSSETRQRHLPQDRPTGVNVTSNFNNEVYHPSFKTLPGASSWAELKAKWHDEKTIVIDDESCTKMDEEAEDCTEVQIVKRLTNPLVGPRNASTLADVLKKLRIIQSAPDKTVRRKKSRYKISYNVYSSAQHYRKSTPGTPMYRVIVIRQKDDPFPQPIELHRLQQDANNTPIVLACVSMSISYIQPGFISVPNLI